MGNNLEIVKCLSIYQHLGFVTISLVVRIGWIMAQPQLLWLFWWWFNQEWIVQMRSIGSIDYLDKLIELILRISKM